jgi:hypothetical protein
MNPNFIPTACGVALAVMAAAVFSHQRSVDDLLVLAEHGAIGVPPQPAASETDAPDPTRSLIAELRRQNQALENSLPGSGRPAGPVSTRPSPATASVPSGDLNQVLAELVELNHALRNQVAETNRDLMELQFQVDTHSEQFRPLNVTTPVSEGLLDDGDDYDTSIGVLPPMDMP